MEVIIEHLTPIIKWVGGKRKLLSEIETLLPDINSINNYYEPFFGGGAVGLHFGFKNLFINDVNKELINMYNCVKTDLNGLLDEFNNMKNTEEEYYKIRNIDRDPIAFSSKSNTWRGARFLYLNRTAFNGLWRENKKGQMNTPYGFYPSVADPSPSVRRLSDRLVAGDCRLSSLDFEEFLKDAKEGDFVYLDPPYDDTFTSYSKSVFDKDSQRRLKAVCDDLTRRGVKWLLSNSATDFIKELYKDYDIHLVNARQTVSGTTDGRGLRVEVLIKNY